MIDKISKTILKLCQWPIFILSFLFPRNKKIWVFGSYKSTTFVDNSKYLFLKLYHQHELDIRAIWITKNKSLQVMLSSQQYECYYKYSFKGLYYAAIASKYIYSWDVNDINWYLSGGAKWINLWHGIPLKKVGFGNKQNEKRAINQKVVNNPFLRLLFLFWQPELRIPCDLFLSTSKEISLLFDEAFYTKRLIEAIYPRVEHFNYKNKELKTWTDKLKTSEEEKLLSHFEKFDKVWIYMPTFRDSAEDDIKMGSKEIFDIEYLSKKLEEKNILLLIKYHMASKLNTTTSSSSSVLYLPSNVDIYLLLPYTDGLITDYSSIFFDYALLNKKMIFYCFDLNDYMSKSRDLNYNYNDIVPGTVVKTFNELCECILTDAESSFDLKPFIKKFWNESLLNDTTYFISEVNKLS